MQGSTYWQPTLHRCAAGCKQAGASMSSAFRAYCRQAQHDDYDDDCTYM